jgi:hypothetical protein
LNGINYMPRLFTGVIQMVTHENATKTVEAVTPTPVAKPIATKPVAASAPVPKVARKAQTKLVTKPASVTPKAVVKSPAAAPANTPAKSAPKPATKPAATKPAVRTTVKAPVKAAVKSLPKPKVKAAKPVKEKKPKLVRDSFTIPKDEYAVLENLKQRAGQLSTQIKKSELLRAGIKALAALSDEAFLLALKLVPTIKTGRPAKD